MKIPCNPKSENAFLQNSPSWPNLLDERTAKRLAKKHGTPLLVGRKSLIRQRFLAIQQYLPQVDIYYAMKANSDRALLRELHEMGAGFDVASEGECNRVRDVCGTLRKTEFSNPCKTLKAIHKAYDYGCRKFVFDCQSELEKLIQLPIDAGLHLRIAVPAGSCRVNLSRRFGTTMEQVESLATLASHHDRNITGLAFHVGSQATDPEDFEVAFKLAEIARKLLYRSGHKIDCLNFGGGFPVDYGARESSQTDSLFSKTDLERYLSRIIELRNQCSQAETNDDFSADQKVSGPQIQSSSQGTIRWMAEPGRSLVAEAVMLLTSVIGVKTLSDGKPLYTIDDGVYGSFSGRYFSTDHFRFFPIARLDSKETQKVVIPSMICGPSCDGGDVLSESQSMPSLKIGSLLQVPMMGAYTSVGASHFNGLEKAKRIWIE
jgi:ornithine decarboxylase